MNEIGVGRVTDRGIVFKELHYSCDATIRIQWYEKARTQGEWDVLVIYSGSNLETILMIEPYSKMLLLCYLISRNSTLGEKLEKYFNSIQKLKAVRSKQLSDKRMPRYKKNPKKGERFN